MGEITTSCYVDIPKIARQVVKDIGYVNGQGGFDGDSCAVIANIDEQSPDIALGVDKALEAKEGRLDDGLDNGAGDQGTRICSRLASAACWVDSTTVSTRTGLPSSPYSTVTCLLPSGRTPPRWTAPPPTPPAGWPKTSWRRVWRTSARCSWPTPSAWPGPYPSGWTPSAPAPSPTEAGISLGPAHHEPPGGVHQDAGVFVQQGGGYAGLHHQRRLDLDLPWEKTDMTGAIKAAL